MVNKLVIGLQLFFLLSNIIFLNKKTFKSCAQSNKSDHKFSFTPFLGVNI